MWAAVKQLTGRRRDNGTAPEVSADTLNHHYANIMTLHIKHRSANLQKHCEDLNVVSEWQVFKFLDLSLIHI